MHKKGQKPLKKGCQPRVVKLGSAIIRAIADFVVVDCPPKYINGRRVGADCDICPLKPYRDMTVEGYHKPSGDHIPVEIDICDLFIQIDERREKLREQQLNESKARRGLGSSEGSRQVAGA